MAGLLPSIINDLATTMLRKEIAGIIESVRSGRPVGWRRMDRSEAAVVRMYAVRSCGWMGGSVRT